MTSVTKKLLAAALTLLLLPAIAMAENSTSNRDYTVHHNAFKNDFLSPEIAQAYGIQRSKFRGMVNISVIKKIEGTTGKAVPAEITIEAKNLLGVLKPLKLREIREEQAIYYIGDFPITDGETVTFKLLVIPEHSDSGISARFSQQFYVD
jgi:hypothetical protein